MHVSYVNTIAREVYCTIRY